MNKTTKNAGYVCGVLLLLGIALLSWTGYLLVGVKTPLLYLATVGGLLITTVEQSELWIKRKASFLNTLALCTFFILSLTYWQPPYEFFWKFLLTVAYAIGVAIITEFLRKSNQIQY